jgi:lysophospholipase L1-like esterase
MKTLSLRSIQLILLAIVSTGPLLAATVQSGEKTPPRTLGRVFSKLRAGRTVTVVFLGGSTTAGVGTSRPERQSYPALVGQWLRSQYPQPRIELVDAAVPATGSVYATLRLRRDVLSYKPDLVILELSREDQSADQQIISKAIEGIIRQLLVQAEPPEILMLYPVSPTGPTLNSPAQAMADHYGVATLDLQAALSATPGQAGLWNREGELSDAGHRLCAEKIIATLQQQMRLPETPLARRLPQPLVSDELNYGEFKVLAEFIPPNGQENGAKKAWKREASRHPRLPTVLATSNRPGSIIETIFEGTVVGLTWLRGPEAGIFEVLIDGKPAPAPLTRIDGYAERETIGTAIIAGGLGLGEHRLTIRLLPARNARSRGNRIKFGYLLIGGQRPERL